MKALAPLLLCAAASVGFTAEPQPVAVGKGSYADFPAASAAGKVTETLEKKLYLVEPNDRPIPTNTWWTDLLVRQYCGKLWAYPLTVSADGEGIEVFYPTRWKDDGRDMVTDFPLKIGARDFHPADARAKEWSDWLIDFRLAETPEKFMDVTLAHGIPFTWIEYTGVAPTISPGEGATFFDVAGQPLAAPNEQSFGVEVGGRAFGVFAPAGTTWSREGSLLVAKFSGAKSYLVIAALPTKEALGQFARHAHAIPRKTEMNWEYDRAKGEIVTRWNLQTEPLEGNAKETIQGWIPHHYRDTKHDLKFEPYTYATPRGLMKCTVGNDFTIRFPFHGILPTLPAPNDLKGEHPFDPARMKSYLATAAANEKYGEDTYWGGKDLTRPADYMMMARQLGDDDLATKLQGNVQRALADWFTYTPGEKGHYFARYPKWKALVGMSGSYGSEEFNDQHFHYGYFTRAAALLGLVSPEFSKDYGGMATLVAKEYANWDRKDPDFPFLRTFDVWSGHSWAGGYSSDGGNNQESSSEAMQSWGGLFLLGASLGDDKMLAAGAMGYAMESRATLEYWLNLHGDNLPSEYGHSTVGILFGGGNAFATYFNGEPAWIHGIQWLPISPVLNYLVSDPAFAKKEFDRMRAEQKEKKGSDEIGALGGGLGNVALGFQQLFDPESVVAQLDDFAASDHAIAKENTAGLTYYYSHANRTLGVPVSDSYIALPTSAVYRNEKSGVTSYLAYNSSDRPQLATVFKNSVSIGRILVPPRTLAHETALLPLTAGGKMITSEPKANAPDVPKTLRNISLVFDSDLDAAKLAGTTIAGPGVSGLSYQNGSGTPVLTFAVNGALQPSQSYKVSIPGNGDFIFRTAALPAFALQRSEPADAAERVPLDLKTIVLQFNNAIDARTLPLVGLRGAGVRGLTPISAGADGAVRFQVIGSLQPDQTYTLAIPAQLRDSAGRALGRVQSLSFSTAPAPLPPVIYADSFGGGGFSSDKSITVDLRNREAPHTGTFAMKLTSTGESGTVYFFNGKTDHGDGRKGVDLSAYDQLEFWIKGTAPDAWVKVGHPVFDQGFFKQEHIEGIGSQYRRYALDLPPNRSDVGTVFVISVPTGQTFFIDDVRVIRGADATR